LDLAATRAGCVRKNRDAHGPISLLLGLHAWDGGESTIAFTPGCARDAIIR